MHLPILPKKCLIPVVTQGGGLETNYKVYTGAYIRHLQPLPMN